MRLVPVFIPETQNQTNNKCLPKLVQKDDLSSSIKRPFSRKLSLARTGFGNANLRLDLCRVAYGIANKRKCSKAGKRGTSITHASTFRDGQMVKIMRQLTVHLNEPKVHGESTRQSE